jgi:site-specific DNA recombinase
MKTAVAYYRYSSSNQKGESIEAQQLAVRSWCEQNNVTLIKEYIDRAESATTDERTEFQEMINQLLSGIIRVDLCLTDKTDRFARNRRDAIVHKYDLNEKGIRYEAVLMPTHGNIFLQAIYEAKDEDYSKNLSEEVKRKMRTHALKSKHLGGIPPLGLDVVEVNKIKQYQINPREQEAVNIMVDMTLEGAGYSEILRVLNEKGYRTKTGKNFGKNSIYEILRNPKIAGIYTYGLTTGGKKMKGRNHHKKNVTDEVVRIPGALPEVVPFEKWIALQKFLDNRKRTTPRRKGEIDYLLTGKLVCGVCGGACVGNSKWNRHKTVHHYLYICNTRKRTKQCDNPFIRKEPIEYYVITEIEKRFFEDTEKTAEEFERLYENKYSNTQQEIKRINREIINVNQQIDRFYAAIGKGLDNEDTYIRIKKLIAEREELEVSIKLLKQQTPWTKERIIQFILANKQAASETSKTAYAKFLINKFVDRVILSPDDIIIEYHFGVVDKIGGPEGNRTPDLLNAIQEPFNFLRF